MSRAFGIALLCLAALAPTRVGADARSVVVQSGDVLGTIAVREGVTVAELKRWNGLESDFIRIGQRLLVEDAKRAERAKPVTSKERAERPKVSSADGIDWTPPFDYGEEPQTNEAPRRETVAARDPSTAVAVRTDAGPPAKKKGRTYTVQKGDTLIGIALRHDTTIDELTKANPGLRPTRIYPGQTIEVGEPKPQVVFRLERGDSLASAASRYGVSSKDVLRWNDRLETPNPPPGTALRIYSRSPVSASEAIGPTNRGRLESPERLPAHRGYVIRTPARAYGTEETIRWIVDAFDAVDRKFRQTKVVRVHDISDRDGGRLRDHKSHQNGRDADISYYQEKCGVNGCRFDPPSSTWLDSGPSSNTGYATDKPR